jgi:hypothetical protein
MIMTSELQSVRRSRRAVRFAFSYVGAEIRLEARQLLDVQTPSSDPILDPERDKPQSGFWIELHDGNGRAIYRRILHNPMMYSADFLIEDGGEVPHIRHSKPRGTFFIVVPNIPAAETLVIYSSPLGYAAAAEAAEPVLRVSLPHP